MVNRLTEAEMATIGITRQSVERMLDAGEDPEFIARRLVIFASEDVGNADPSALSLASSAADAVRFVGMPEGYYPLAQCSIYLACAPKSNAVGTAYKRALDRARQHGALPVPLHLRNAPTKLMKEIGYGKDYKYAHQYEDNFADLEYLPDQISNTTIFEPGNNAREQEVKKWLKKRWKDKYDY